MEKEFLKQSIKTCVYYTTSSILIGLTLSAIFVGAYYFKDHAIHNDVIYAAIILGITCFLGSFLSLMLVSKDKEYGENRYCYETLEASDCSFEETLVEGLLNKKEKVHY
ncbi:hypothetical protein [Candidatus Neoehrlichia procyonis]|uniref:Uncharacterized protein n=1 Tax=Candidatus Neoehrlichia procyonis str. RAC413 TaxID=1359163 RepID=A0A0F3NPE0_9RICK|nr:hypothetical protein [Candidatus Neoehrlichia lotoris]KJV68779.1 hypothetical protein NLO413_0143 [Candidatus Neoehrlichia lotoris str. RAC413]